ncbi:hypothetical protein ACFYV7_12905 [Nocardia suismassiliense]|uniref:DUF7336 domain-containing protein n=1 Tax=Nocardia suismassiliense TaxID=2077092 RepID=A0ABW6QRX7_9NOCA
MDHVYLLQHYYELPNGAERLRTIGAYATEVDAQRAIERASILPGFRDRPDDFHILRHPLNKDHWTEGFFTA